MSNTHEFIKDVLNDTRETGKDGFHWHHILTALHDIIATKTRESEEVLRAILEFKGEITLSHESPLTHSLSPTNMMRSMAIQILAKWDKEKHHDLINKVAQSTSSDRLKAIAEAHLK